ncbi:hypothetical protein Z043_100481 [Scleropages formosus]|uniref:Macro domain-containing protein n=1 Tax=Scleropages formosus TaxID=113540 RepID=A0A0P7XX62_SCLFO|nr:hypothetical protein Z043_100481 [Scleropages formosus]
MANCLCDLFSLSLSLSSVDGSIHRGAGPLLKKECATLGGCETSQAKITGAYGLPAKYVIHTVGPIAQGVVGDREREELRSCYRNCLDTATQNQLRTVAFPCISTGVYGYPPDKAVDVALTVVREYLEKHPAQLDRVIFCVFLKSDEDLYQDRLPRYFPHGECVQSFTSASVELTAVYRCPGEKQALKPSAMKSPSFWAPRCMCVSSSSASPSFCWLSPRDSQGSLRV